MRKAITIFLVGCLIGAPTVVLAVKVTAVPAAVAKKYSIDTKWYKKYTTVHAMGFDVSATYDWTDKDSIQFSASSPLRVEQGSLVIESPYDRERVQLSPNTRQLDYGVAYTRKFKMAALTTTLQFTEDSGHYQG